MRVEEARKTVNAVIEGNKALAINLILEDVAKDVETKSTDVKVRNLTEKVDRQHLQINMLVAALYDASDKIDKLIDKVNELEGKVPEASSVERIKLEAKRVCQTCGKPIEGRGTKKFCDDCKKKRDKESKRTCTSKRKTFVDRIEEKESRAKEEAGEGLKELAKELASGIS